MTRKLIVRIEGSRTVITLDRPLEVSSFDSLRVERCTTYWMYRNINRLADVWIERTKNGATAGFAAFSEVGYTTFEDISKKMLDYGITLTRIPINGKTNMELEAGITGVMFSPLLSRILGFEKGITYTNSRKSPNVVDMNDGLRYVKVRCNAVNSATVSGEKGVDDTIVTCIPLPTNKSPFGNVVINDSVRSRAMLTNGKHTSLEFTVTDQDDKPIDIGMILLECYVT